LVFSQYIYTIGVGWKSWAIISKKIQKAIDDECRCFLPCLFGRQPFSLFENKPYLPGGEWSRYRNRTPAFGHVGGIGSSYFTIIMHCITYNTDRDVMGRAFTFQHHTFSTVSHQTHCRHCA